MKRNKLFSGCQKYAKSFGRLIFIFLCLAMVFSPASSHAEKADHSGKASTKSESGPESGGYSHSKYPLKLQQKKNKPLKDQASEHGTEQVVRLTPEMLKLSDIQTASVQYHRLAREIQTVGEISYDERRVRVVSAWIGGRIDKLYVDFTGVHVKKGDPLAELYSPELISTQQEFILALETRGRLWSLGNQEALQSANHLVEATRRRLTLWGISKEQIDEIERTRKVKMHMTIHAPIGGTVIHKLAYEGQYVKTGEKLYTIVDLSVVWAVADIYEYEMALIKRGQKVSITTHAYPGHEFTGTISFIDPFLNTKTRSVKVRMDVPNKNLILKPGMFAEARLKIPLKDLKAVLAIPSSAVLDTGTRRLAYVDLGHGVFKPIEIKVGPKAGKWVQVLAGLKKGQRVAVSANYLIDSQRTLGSGASGGASGHSGH